jgi:hypothetical protein
MAQRVIVMMTLDDESLYLPLSTRHWVGNETSFACFYLLMKKRTGTL